MSHEQADKKLNVLSVSTKTVIPEVAKSACGGEYRENNRLLDTPSTLLRVVSLSNHGSQLRLVRYDVWGLSQAFSSACL